MDVYNFILITETVKMLIAVIFFRQIQGVFSIMIKRKVCIVYGEWGKDTDFVLEPVCKECEIEGKECETCKDYIWIMEVDE